MSTATARERRQAASGGWLAQVLMLGLMLALTGCSTLPPVPALPKGASHALANPETTTLGRAAATAASRHPGTSGFRILDAGVDGFLARRQMIDAAERTLDVQYYIFHLDQTGGLIADALLRAADRGVRVRILLDDGDTLPGDDRLLMLQSHPRIEVRVFNPFTYRGHSVIGRAAEFVASGRRVDYRMHNKLFVADNAAALVGGRNIGDEYFQVDPAAQFGDDDVFAMGPIVRELSLSFDDYWNSPMAVPAGALANGKPDPDALASLRATLEASRQEKHRDGVDWVARIATGEPLRGLVGERPPLEWATATLLVDTPEKRSAVAAGALGLTTAEPVQRAIAGVRSELLVVTPFFVPGTDGVALLADLHRRGADVRILTNSLESTSEPAAHAAYRRYRPDLLAAGIRLYEVRARLGSPRGSGQPAWMNRFGTYGLHAKLFVFDRSRVFVGSLNFDKRSERINTEIGLIIDSPVLAAQVATRFNAIAGPRNSYAVTLKPPPGGGAPALAWTSEEDGRTVQRDLEPARSDWQRFKVGVMSVLPVDGEM